MNPWTQEPMNHGRRTVYQGPRIMTPRTMNPRTMTPCATRGSCLNIFTSHVIGPFCHSIQAQRTTLCFVPWQWSWQENACLGRGKATTYLARMARCNDGQVWRKTRPHGLCPFTIHRSEFSKARERIGGFAISDCLASQAFTGGLLLARLHVRIVSNTDFAGKRE